MNDGIEDEEEEEEEEKKEIEFIVNSRWNSMVHRRE